MRRHNETDLKRWLNQINRKPLVLRGARQVGKTHLIRQFAKNESLDLIEINFDFNPEAISLFHTLDLKKIKNLIKANYGKDLNSKTVLFFDEIQKQPEIFNVLRYLYESSVDFPIIAAGSLLEFALIDKNISLPVGRIEYHFLGPCNFKEFLSASNQDNLVNYLESYQLTDSVPEIIHQKISSYFLEYLALGGMPEVIQRYIDTADLNDCDRIKSLIVKTYEDDFHKYRDLTPWDRIRSVYKSVPQQAGEKFTYSKISKEEKASPLSKALDLLCLAQVCHRVYHSHAEGLPLGAQIKKNYFKVLFLDFGLSHSMLGLNTKSFFLTHQNLNSLFKGSLFEQVIGQQLMYLKLPYIQPEIFTWAREKSQSSAEIDYIIEIDGQIIPVEVKSGSTGHLKSLHLFMNHRNLKLGVRFNTESPSIFESEKAKIISLPAYLATETYRLLKN
jgi:uncharacterized protein